jgi:hypothetical protein
MRNTLEDAPCRRFLSERSGRNNFVNIPLGDPLLNTCGTTPVGHPMGTLLWTAPENSLGVPYGQTHLEAHFVDPLGVPHLGNHRGTPLCGPPWRTTPGRPPLGDTPSGPPFGRPPLRNPLWGRLGGSSFGGQLAHKCNLLPCFTSRVVQLCRSTASNYEVVTSVLTRKECINQHYLHPYNITCEDLPIFSNNSEAMLDS